MIYKLIIVFLLGVNLVYYEMLIKIVVKLFILFVVMGLIGIVIGIVVLYNFIEFISSFYLGIL